MTGRTRRRPRQACRLPGVVDSCLAFGQETACSLCNMIDFDHPTTCATLGRYPVSSPVADPEALFWAHLARRSDGGPTTRAALIESWDPRTPRGRERPWRADHQFWQPVSDLPVEPPF